ncbi:MAG: CrcB family protein [Chloroflexi bacterium]|nr:CrcB family protein [Chloroflexota bacterium]
MDRRRPALGHSRRQRLWLVPAGPAIRIGRRARRDVCRGTWPTHDRLRGAYTTFSTLALESWRLLEDGAWLHATANLAGSAVVGVLAVVVGVALGRAI